MPQGDPDTNAFDVGASQSVQQDFDLAAGNLEAAITRHDADVRNTMIEYEAEEVSDGYRAMEKTWFDAGTEVKAIITLLRESLSKNDDVAVSTMRKAMSHVSV